MSKHTKIKCVCEDCGKEFNKGDEGDNERFCLRCEFLDRRRFDEERNCLDHDDDEETL